MSNISVLDTALSDHSCVFFDIAVMMDTCNRSEMIRKCYFSENSCVAFSQAISMLPSSQLKSMSIDDLMDNFNYKILYVADIIAPVS